MLQVFTKYVVKNIKIITVCETKSKICSVILSTGNSFLMISVETIIKRAFIIGSLLGTTYDIFYTILILKTRNVIRSFRSILLSNAFAK